MTDYVIVVAKQDELMAVEWAFQTHFGKPDERTRSGVEIYRREFPAGKVSFALLDKQTNTYSSLLTAEVIGRETPRLIFLVGTAMGRAGRVSVGSVVVSDGIIDVSEKRYADDGRGTYVVRGPSKSDELTLDAKDYIARSFTQGRVNSHLRSMVRKPVLVKARNPKMTEFIAANGPTVICEPIVSGNEYRMGQAEGGHDDVWNQAPLARAYDMEAAGFALAASNNGVQWLVVRGISDHGTPETKSDFHRTVATGIAARFLADFLAAGLVRSAQLPILQEPAITLPQLRDEAFRLDGTWEGAMAYLDDNLEPVVFEERAEFAQDGSNVQGMIKSRRIRGAPRHDDLEYQIAFSIARNGHAGGVWSETIATRRYFGVILGQLEEDSTVLAGTWLGTHKNGVRKGFFKWHNTRRDGQPSHGGFDLDSIVGELLASFSVDPARAYNDSCRVAP